MLAKIWTFIKHNQALVVGTIVCSIILAWGYGCEPVTRSPFNLQKRVTRTELDILTADYANKIASAYEDLKRQEQVRDAILNAGLAYAQGSGIDPVGLALTIAGILGIGIAVDNRRKDTVIKAKDNAINTLYHTLEAKK